MTKTKKIISIAIVAPLIIILFLSLVADKHISITTRQHVNAQKKEVFEQIVFMKNYPNWSPFKVQDPEQEFKISGKDGSVGATFHWKGVKEESEGYQTITSINGMSQVHIDCVITVPFEAHPKFNYQLLEKDGGVEVIQSFDVEMPFPSNIFGLLFGVKEQMAQTNQNGLNLLKTFIENKKI